MRVANNPRRAEHDELRMSMARFADLLKADAQVDHAALIRERMLFAQLFKHHLAHEQEEIAELSRMNDTLAGKAKARGIMIADLRADYSAHVGHWTPLRIKADWLAYRRAVLDLQARLRRFMLWEEENLPLYA